MNCRAHHEAMAIGMCQGCGSGLCAACAGIRSDAKLVCGDVCAERVRLESKAMEELLRKAREGKALTRAMGLLFGSLFLVFAPFPVLRMGERAWDLSAFLLLASVAMFVIAYKYRKKA